MKDSTYENLTEAFLIENAGFHGHLFRPFEDGFSGLSVIVLGGGGVPYKLTLDEAQAFADMGITALAVGYFNVVDAPKTIVNVPIEYVENAARYLYSLGFDNVVVAGISKGAELALTAASLIPEINGAIAFSPPSRVYMGVGPGISWVDSSSWTFRGNALPYAYAPASGIRALMESLRAGELTFRSVYERANSCACEESIIPAEKIHGPILLCASSNDSLWPSEKACEEIAARLDAKGFAFPCKTLVYPYASHILLPFETGYERFFRIGRSHPQECLNTIEELRFEMLDWLHCLET